MGGGSKHLKTGGQAVVKEQTYICTYTLTHMQTYIRSVVSCSVRTGNPLFRPVLRFPTRDGLFIAFHLLRIDGKKTRSVDWWNCKNIEQDTLQYLLGIFAF